MPRKPHLPPAHFSIQSVVAFLLCWTLLGFHQAHGQTMPNTTTNRYADAADAAYWPTVNVGDYIFFKGNQQPSNAIYAKLSHLTITLPVGGKILIWGGDYPRIHIEGDYCASTPEQPTVITNLGGQVRWGNSTASDGYRTFEIANFANVHLTGKYVPGQTGDPGYLGHNGGANLGTGDYYEKYGFWGHQKYSGIRYNGGSPNMVRILGFDTCKVDYVAAWGGGFAGFNIKTDNPAVPGRVTIDVQDCFSGFASGEGFYIGSTKAATTQDISKLTLRNNIVVCAGAEAYQTGLLTSGSVIENNVAFGSAAHFRIPFQLYQQGLQQLTFVEGGVTSRNNLLIGGCGPQQNIAFEVAGAGRVFPSASDPIVMENNYMGYGRTGVMYLNGGDGITPYQFINNVYGPNTVPHTNDAYANLAEPGAGMDFASTNQITVSGNRFDPARPAYYSRSNITATQNIYAEAPMVRFKNTGFPNGSDYTRITYWAPAYETTNKAGQYIPYTVGDIVHYFDSQGNTKFFQCIANHSSNATTVYEPNTSPAQWQQMTWNGRNMPPLDVRIEKNSYYNYRGIGLTYNEANTTASDVTSPIITVLGGDISVAKGSAFVDPGVLATDNKDGNVTSLVTSAWVGSPINTNILGEYTLSYRVVDAAGNISDPTIRVITVSDVNVTLGPIAKINLHNNRAVNIPTVTLPGWTDAGNSNTGVITAKGTPTLTNTIYGATGSPIPGWALRIDNIEGGYSEHYNKKLNAEGRDIGEFPASVTICGLKIRDPHENPCVFVFTGLNPAKFYDIRYTGYNEGADGLLTAQLTDTISGRSAVVNVQNNNSDIGEVCNVQPDSTGKMQLSFSTTTPGSQPNISALIVQEKTGYGSFTQPPTIAAVANQTINQSSTLSGVPITLSDTDTAPSSLQMWARSSNTALIPDSSIVITGTGLNRTMAITPTAGQSGAATITLFADDGVNVTNTSFGVTVVGYLANDLTSAGLTGLNIGTSSSGSGRILVDGKWEIIGAGSGLTSAATDSFHYQAADVLGDFQMVVTMNSLTGGSAARAGLMLREGTGAGARMVYLSTSTGSSYKYGSRAAVGGAVTETTPAGAYAYPNAWLYLARAGTTVQLAVSSNGLTFTQVGTVTLASLTSSVKAGVFSSSGVVGVDSRAVMSNYSLEHVAFSQDFQSTTVVSEYAQAAPNNTQFNQIGFEASGGTWSINSAGQLQLARVAGASPNNGAGMTRFTDFSGPPALLSVKFDFGVSVNVAQNDLMTLDIGNITSAVDYNGSTPSASTFGRLNIDGVGTSGFRFESGGTQSANYAANGTMYSITYLLNKSGAQKSYVGPNGQNKVLDTGRVAFWVGTTCVFDNVLSMNGSSSALTDLRIRFPFGDNGTWKFDNFLIETQF